MQTWKDVIWGLGLFVPFGLSTVLSFLPIGNGTPVTHGMQGYHNKSNHLQC